MSDASRSRRRGLVLRFVLIALMVLAVNTLIQLFIGASLGVVENLCWIVSAALLGWAGSFGHDRLSGEWPGAEQDAAAAARPAPSEPAPPPAGSPEPAPVGTCPATVEPAPPTEPVMPRPGPIVEASSQPTPIDPVRVDPTPAGPAAPAGPARVEPAPATTPAPPTPARPAAAPTGQPRPPGPPPATPGDRRWRRTSGRWFRR